MNDQMIIKGDWSSFVNLRGEELLFVKRKHTFTLIYPIFLIVLVSAIITAGAYGLFWLLLHTFSLFLVSLFLILTAAVSQIIYTIVYWYFHLYVLTTRKILEVKYTPLFSHVVNDVFLDSVNCTEIDLTSKGFFHELIDMGDLTITFDRPTHQEEFMLESIKDCDSLGKYLTQKLMEGRKKLEGDTIWLKGRSTLAPKVAV